MTSRTAAAKDGPKNHDARIAGLTFASVYPHYVTKVEKKGRTKAELHEVIRWLTGYDEAALQRLIDELVEIADLLRQRLRDLLHAIAADDPGNEVSVGV